MVEARIDARKVKSPDGQTGDKNGTFVKLEDSFFRLSNEFYIMWSTK